MSKKASKSSNAKAPKANGRPSKYSKKLVERILAEIREGRSLRSICARDEGMPSYATVFRWLNSNLEFQKSFKLAKRIGEWILLDEITDITNNFLETCGDKTLTKKERAELIARTQLQLDVKKWEYGRMQSKKYHD